MFLFLINPPLHPTWVYFCHTIRIKLSCKDTKGQINSNFYASSSVMRVLCRLKFMPQLLKSFPYGQSCRIFLMILITYDLSKSNKIILLSILRFLGLHTGYGSTPIIRVKIVRFGFNAHRQRGPYRVVPYHDTVLVRHFLRVLPHNWCKCGYCDS